jgi:hypothetical protein
MTPLPDQVPGEHPDRFAPEALVLSGRRQVDVDPGVAVHRVLLLVELDRPDHLAVDLDHQGPLVPTKSSISPGSSGPHLDATAGSFRIGRRRDASSGVADRRVTRGPVRITLERYDRSTRCARFGPSVAVQAATAPSSKGGGNR